jgi:hypothetical protein
MKSLVGLEALRAKDPDLARAWINTALPAALLTDADADPTSATAEAGEEDEDGPATFAKEPALSP